MEPIPFQNRMTISTSPRSMIGSDTMLKGVRNLPLGFISASRNRHTGLP